MRGNDNKNPITIRLLFAYTALITLSKIYIFFLMQILENHKNRDIFSVMVFWTIFILCLLGATVSIALALARDADMPGYYNVFMMNDDIS